jgi:hypothetical protein
MTSSSRFMLTIGNDPPFVWFRVAKVGTRTILTHLRAASVVSDHYEHGVDRLPEGYEDHFAFAFVRNPWDRLVSCWHEKVVGQNYFGFDPGQYERMRRFDEFVRYVTELELDHADRHLRLQSRLIDLKRIDFLGRMERFDEHLNIVFSVLGIPPDPEPRNVTERRDPYPEYYDDELRDVVAMAYERDIQIFGYTFDS